MNKKENCVFCKIINGELPSEIVGELEHVIAIKNINPVAPVHNLILPKKHFEQMNSVDETNKDLVWDMWKMVRLLSSELELPKHFNIVANNGSEAGQSVFHLHWHFISGKNLYTSGWSL